MPDYRDFFALKQSPFELQSLRPLVLETGPMRRVGAWIRSELAAGTPLLAVLGSQGIGKSSTAMALLHLLEDRVAGVPDPTLPWNELAASIAKQFELDAKSLSREALLAGRPAPTVRLVLVVDDADELPAESLTRLQRVLDYADARGRPLVRCILLAQASGRASQATRWVTAVKSRIELAPMLARELHRYIEARLQNAGWKGGDLFTREAVEAIHHASGGSPLTANRICEALLVEAAQRQESSIEQGLAEEICAELHLGPVASEEEATEPALRIDVPTPNPDPVESDAPLPATRPASEEEQEATEPAYRPPSRVEAPNHEAAPPPPEDWRAPEAPSPQGPGGHEPAPPTNAGSPIGAALAARLAALKSLAAHWDHRRWQAPVAAIGLIAVLFVVGQIDTVQTVERETVGRAAGGAARVASEHTEPPMPASGTTVNPVREWQQESEPTWLVSLRKEFERAAEVTDPERTEANEAVAPERAEGSEPVASAATETPDRGVAEPAETGRTQTAKPSPPARWLDDLELALDAKAGQPDAPRPSLALPEPELSRGFSPGGEAP
jgi:type II secretory pathway predicted ATPase ExeA